MSANSPLQRLRGVIAALLVPRTEDGAVDAGPFQKNLSAVIDAGVDGLSIGGATGEYPQQDEGERIDLMRQVGRAAVSARKHFVPAVGAGNLRQTLRLADVAAECGATAVLLPPPLFFRYSQDDLVGFYAEAAEKSPVPVLIYNLPSFVSPVHEATAVRLARMGIAGIKDSSGSLDILRAYTSMSDPMPKRFVGNDSALVPALESGVCDGCISGVAGVLPELLVAIENRSLRASKSAIFAELLQLADDLPAPWGLKVIAELRGWGNQSFPFPTSAGRNEGIRRLAHWVQSRMPELTSTGAPALADRAD